MYWKGNYKLLHIRGLFYFQLATGGIESAVYKKLIAPIKNDLPVSFLVGYRRVCAEHKYAYLGPDILKAGFMSLPCQPVPLPEPTYKATWGFIIPKNSPYKGLINWRWVNWMRSISYMTHKSRYLWVHDKLPNSGRHFCLLFDTRALNKWRHNSYLQFFQWTVCWWISL
jgi:hypothetical protein